MTVLRQLMQIQRKREMTYIGGWMTELLLILLAIFESYC